VDDRALVAAMVRRDPAGLDGVYRRYVDRLYAYCVMVLRDGDAAADAVQETFLLASERAAQLRDPDRLRPWLYAIARNECLRLTRVRRRSASLDEAGDVAAEPVDAGAGVHALQLRELIGAASASLSAADREVIDLSVRHGLDAAEVGAVLGVSSNHAHARMSRARGQLQRALGALLVARSTVDCPTLRELRQGWGGQLTPLLRKRISRHIDDCTACSAQQREQLQPAALLPAYTALAFAVAPVLLRPSTAGAGSAGASAAGTSPGTANDGAPRSEVKLGRDGFPRQDDATSPWPRRLAVAAAVVLLLLLGGGVALSQVVDERTVATGPSPSSSAAAGGALDPGLQAPPAGEPSPTSTDGPDPGQPDPQPTTSGPLVLVAAFTGFPTAGVTCTDLPTGKYRLTVSVQASAPLHTAVLARKLTGGSLIKIPVVPTGNKATWTNNNLSADTTTWWVELTSTSGDTFSSTPKDTDNPCPKPEG
jgi:RNA polymerase sigma factor (sigma-70 family)